MPQYVAVNERGLRIGEGHHNSTIPDAVVDKIREMHEDRGKSYRQISMRLDIPIPTVAKICRYERRAQTPERWVRVD